MNTPPLIEDAIEVEVLDKDLYRSRSLWRPSSGRGVFGGQTIAQATWAATLSVLEDTPDLGKGLHSLHCYFLSFGDADHPIIYQVTRLRDGRSYSTRNVLATQGGKPIFTLSCSFCLPEPNQPTRMYPIPKFNGSKMPEPEDCLPTEIRLNKALDDSSLHPKLRTFLERYASERTQSSIEIRSADASELGEVITSQRHAQAEPEQAIWFRSRAPVRKDPAFQKCVLAYASDMSFIGTAARAVGLGYRTNPALGMVASLDHSMHFYDDTIDTTDFSLFYIECPIVGNGRGTVSGRIYKRDGTLAVLCTQEGVVRAAL